MPVGQRAAGSRCLGFCTVEYVFFGIDRLLKKKGGEIREDRNQPVWIAKKEEYMMNVEKIVKGTYVELKVSGRLDTTTAPELEQTVDGSLEGTQELVMNFEGLEYVSSAGLRVILKAQKQMNARGTMKVIHVNETIMEVLDITGFADILTIE